MGSVIMSLLPLGLLAIIGWAIFRALKSSAEKNPPIGLAEDGLAGVGGWLLYLILGLMFLGPLMGAGRINTDIISAESKYPALLTVTVWAKFKTATWISFMLICCVSFYAGYGLLKVRHYLAVNRAKTILWFIGPIANLHMGVLLPLFIFGKVESDPQVVGAVVTSAIAAAIWTAYLSKSRRVKATYGEASNPTGS